MPFTPQITIGDSKINPGQKVWVWVEMALRAALNGGAGGSGARKKAKP